MRQVFTRTKSSVDWKKVLARDDIDIVDISTPGNMRHPMAIAAANGAPMRAILIRAPGSSAPT